MRAERVLHWPLEKRETSVWRGLIAGGLAGLAGTVIMTQFQNAWNTMAGKEEEREPENKQDRQEEPATVKAAERLSKAATGTELKENTKKQAGQVVHYGFGTAVGAVYGGVAEVSPRLSMGRGLPFGTAVWLGADEITVPLLGLSESPAQVPLKSHLYGLLSHAVYGLSTDLIRRTVRRVL
jgi:uncharacterized membrane protein YagU involved in acid resistance